MPGETMYDDILRKYQGDHDAAVAAMKRLGLHDMIPAGDTLQAHAASRSRMRAARHSERQQAARQAGAQERMRPSEIVPIQPPQAGFFCPLTGILMRDPVILEESAISYERSAIAWALHVEPGRCPLSGVVLKSSRMHPDVDLRRRIISWASANQPDVLDSTGNLRPFHFRNGIDKAIRDHRAVSAAISAGGGSSMAGSVDPYSASLMGGRPGNPGVGFSTESNAYSLYEPQSSTLAGESAAVHGGITYGRGHGGDAARAAPRAAVPPPQARGGGTPGAASQRPTAIAEESMYESYDSADSGTEVYSVGVGARAMSRVSEDGDADTGSRRPSGRVVRGAAAVTPTGSPLRSRSQASRQEMAARSPLAVAQPDTPPRHVASPLVGGIISRNSSGSGGGALVKPPLAAGGVAGVKLQSAWGKAGSGPHGSAPEPALSPRGSLRMEPQRSLTPRESGTPDAKVTATIVRTQSAKGPGGRTTTIVRTSSRPASLAGSDVAPMSPGPGLSRQSTADGVPLTPPSSDWGSRNGAVPRGPPVIESTVNSTAPGDAVARGNERLPQRFAGATATDGYVPPMASAPRDVSPATRGRGGAAWNAGRYATAGRSEGRPGGVAAGAAAGWDDAGDVYGRGRQREGGADNAPADSGTADRRRERQRKAAAAAGGGAAIGVAVAAVMQDSAEDVYGKGRGAANSADGEWVGADSRVPDTAYAGDSGAARYTPPAAPLAAPYGGFLTYDVNDQLVEPLHTSEPHSDFQVPADGAPMDPLLPPRPRHAASLPRLSRNGAATSHRESPSGRSDAVAADAALARKLAEAPAGHSDGLSSSAFARPPQDILLHHTLKERARGAARAFALLGPAATLVTVAGFLVPLAYNDWGVADVSDNPWIGARRATLRKVGAACSSCALDGEWWRLFSSLFIMSGVAMALFNALLFGAAANLAGRTGMSVWAFLACTAAGALVGTVTSAVAASNTVHSTSTAIPAAAAAAALVAALSVRRFLQSWVLPTLLLFLWLALLAVACLAPFADTWATAAGAVVGGVCALSAMAPYSMKRGAKSSERWLIIWQVFAACIVVALAAGVVVALLAMPDRGYECGVCDEANCQNILGWDCKNGIDRQGSCQLLVFPDSSGSLVCPTEDRVDLGTVQTPFRQDLSALCAERCGEGAGASGVAAPNPPQSSGRSSGGGAAS